MSPRRTLDAPITVEQWWKNRGGEVIRLELSTYEGRNILNLRTWHTDKSDGVMRPGKGFACSAKHLPKLVEVFGKAEDRARELGLIDDDEGGK
jgi:Transcriptional Coactivator p15 (PC4)